MAHVYVLSGSVQGTCSHHHSTLVGAARCAYLHEQICNADGRFCDRQLKVSQPGGPIDATFEEVRQFQVALEIERQSHLREAGKKWASTFAEFADRGKS